MNRKIKKWIFPLTILGASLLIGCKKELPKKDPVITWTNPSDITYGTLLSNIQLNATANVPGIFIYTPAIGTKLDIGTNQELKADFVPSDPASYNTVSQTVKINVIELTVTDADGNVYHTVTIGTQVWMVESLRTTKYNDNSTIPNITDRAAWAGLTTPGFCTYNNTSNPDTISTYGRLYNWYAVNTNKLAPIGWHIPNSSDWNTLTTFLGGEAEAGGKLKEFGTSHWNAPNACDQNNTGFKALPGGSRSSDGDFCFFGTLGFWWSSSKFDDSQAWHQHMVNNLNSSYLNATNKGWGFSIRCLKDN